MRRNHDHRCADVVLLRNNSFGFLIFNWISGYLLGLKELLLADLVHERFDMWLTELWCRLDMALNLLDLSRCFFEPFNHLLLLERDRFLQPLIHLHILLFPRSLLLHKRLMSYRLMLDREVILCQFLLELSHLFLDQLHAHLQLRLHHRQMTLHHLHDYCTGICLLD